MGFIGEKYNMLTVLEFSHRKNGIHYYVCRCDCGNEKILNVWNVRRGVPKSCGCLSNKGNNKYIGRKVFHLYVEALSHIVEGKGKKYCYSCVCDCGNKVVYTSTDIKMYKRCKECRKAIKKYDYTTRIKNR